MRRAVTATWLLWAVLLAVPLPAHAQGCYPPACGGSADRPAAAAAAAAPSAPLPLVPTVKTDPAPDSTPRSPGPVVAIGLLMVSGAFGTIASRRRLAIARRGPLAPVPGGMPTTTPTPTTAHPRRQPDRSFR
jgi:hypothetical protein